MTSRLFPVKTKPATVCRVMAIDKGLNKKTAFRRIKAKHAPKGSVNRYNPPSEAMMINVRKYNRGQGLLRFA